MRGTAQRDGRPRCTVQTPIFITKFESFRYRGNRGRSGANLNDAIKLATPEPPVLYIQESWE